MTYTIGGDLGKSVDNAAIAVLKHKPNYKEVERVPGTRHMAERGIRVLHSYDLVTLEKMPLGTPYPKVVERFSHYYNHPKLLQDVDLVVDAGGVGSAVYDFLRQAGLPAIGVVTTAGNNPIYDEKRNMWSLPKKDLVAALVSLYQTGRLKMNPKLPFLDDFKYQLEGFTAKLKKDSTHLSYEALTEDVHDDLVIAVALAAWWAQLQINSLDEILKEHKKKDYDPRRFRLETRKKGKG